MTQRKILRLPITNIYAKGAFCVTVSLGSENDTTNLILDTGSSSFIEQIQLRTNLIKF